MMENQQKLQTMAADNVPAFPDTTEIVNMVIAVCLGKKSKDAAVKELMSKYKGAAVLHIENKARQKIEEMISQSENESVRSLSNKDYSKRLVESTKGIAGQVHRLYRNEISIQELIDGLSETGIKDIAKDTVCALQIPEKLNVKDVDQIMQLSADMAAYSSLTAAYQELMKALEDERIAHERRLQIEAECTKTITEITKYRKDMEMLVRQYMTNGYETMESGFAAIDKAIMDDDTDGYIRGNVELQKLLGYDVQFTNQAEFDNLMDSDEAFKF